MLQKIRIRPVRLIGLLLLITVLAWIPAASAQTAWAASSAPGINARITVSNIQKLLAKYDTDGAYIIKKQLAAGDNILAWFSNSKRIADGIDTAVHEETHGYSYAYAKRSGMAYFVGNKRTVYVPYTSVYPSKKMAASIPKSLRTFRYNTYVGQPSANLSSNVNGAYGLLNEFMAYRAGMKTTVSLYSYFADKKASWDVWTGFISGCESNKLAYGEFKYYILHYLYYAKKHQPAVYKGIVNNRNFCKAYRIIESNYAKQIRLYETNLKKMKKILEKRGYRVTISKDFVTVYNSRGTGEGRGRFTADYNRLKKQCSKSKYASIHKKLVNNGK
ncbi:MAG: hypothetical protein HFE76_10965 [Firmicutes bacterium]|nr:hypothetical protein [Bacillota bacterium]